jgi:hypothetical protein
VIYTTIDVHPSRAEVQRVLDVMSAEGWLLKSTLSGMHDAKDGWLTFIFEKRV